MARLTQIFLLALTFIPTIIVNAQVNQTFSDRDIKSRLRVIIDNDFGGDPDGLFQLAHHLLSPSVDIRAIIGSQHYANGFYGYPGHVDYGCAQARELLKVINPAHKTTVLEGADQSLVDTLSARVSAGAQFIVREAMRNDVKSPLYVVCGAGLTTIASAYLMEPKIAKRIVLIWIGGPEYDGLAIPPPKASKVEYNLGIDRKAAQVIFNVSDIQIWQVPRDAYRQPLYSYAELAYKIGNAGELGKYLKGRLDDLMSRAKGTLGETYVLGDSPLVLLTALQSTWEPDPSSSSYVLKQAPIINNLGAYLSNPSGRSIRVFTRLDTRLIFEDMLAKFALHQTSN